MSHCGFDVNLRPYSMVGVGAVMFGFPAFIYHRLAAGKKMKSSALNAV